MVMVTKSNSSRRPSQSLGSEISEKHLIPPWCSGRAYERRRPRKVAPSMKSAHPVHEYVRECLNGDRYEYSSTLERTYNTSKTQIKVKSCKRGNAANVKKKLLISLLLTLALILIGTYLINDNILRADFIAKILPKTNFISYLGIDSTTVSEECCHRMRHLELALRRAEHTLRWVQEGASRSKALRVRKTMLSTQHLHPGLCPVTLQTKTGSHKGYIEGSRAYRGSNTVEWEARAALWGVVPLWRAAPSPDIILSLRRAVPSDCWPIRGTNGEVIIIPPRNVRVDFLSLEHIWPDTANSAPKDFTVYGILSNGTWIKAADGAYQRNRAAKQYYRLDNRNSPLQQVVFRVLSNQGNPNYTCIYRIHLYSSTNL